MRRGDRRHHAGQQRHLPRQSRRRTVAIAVAAVGVVAAASLGIDVGATRAAVTAPPRPVTAGPVLRLAPPAATWSIAPTAPTVPATAGTPLALLRANAGKGAAPTLQPEAFNALTLRAYVAASTSVAARDPGCGISWQVLAGIGRIESDNGRDVGAGGGMTADGTIAPPILGPALDGTDGFAAIPAGDGWAHATGPFQFIPSTWQAWGADGNGDGTKDVDNIFDASLGAAHYLCAGGRSLTHPTQLADAVYSYNHSRQYVQLVLQLVAGYSHESAATLLAQAQLQRLPAGTAVTAAPTTTTAGWAAPALTARVRAGSTVSLRPLATAPVAARSAALDVLVQPGHGRVVAVGSTIVVHTAAGVVGTETFRYAVAGHGSALATVDLLAAAAAPTAAKPTTSKPARAPGGPVGTFTATVKPDGAGLDLSGTDTGTGSSVADLTVMSSWTFALEPTAPGGTATLVLPDQGSSPAPSASPSPGSFQAWRISQTWSAGGLDEVVIYAVTTCDATETCAMTAGPPSVGVEGGSFARATHDLVVADEDASSDDATATTALPISGPQLRLQATTS